MPLPFREIRVLGAVATIALRIFFYITIGAKQFYEDSQETKRIFVRAVVTGLYSNVNSGNVMISPPFIADSWARIPTQVMFADCCAFG